MLLIFGQTAANSTKLGLIGYAVQTQQRAYNVNIIASQHATVKEESTIKIDWIKFFSVHFNKICKNKKAIQKNHKNCFKIGLNVPGTKRADHFQKLRLN